MKLKKWVAKSKLNFVKVFPLSEVSAAFKIREIKSFKKVVIYVTFMKKYILTLENLCLMTGVELPY